MTRQDTSTRRRRRGTRVGAQVGARHVAFVRVHVRVTVLALAPAPGGTADHQTKGDYLARKLRDRRAPSPQPSLEARREMADRGERAADDGSQRRASWSGAGFEEASGHDARGDGVDLRKNGGSRNRPEALGPRRPRAGRVRFKKLDLVFSRQSRSSELDSPIFSSAAGPPLSGVRFAGRGLATKSLSPQSLSSSTVSQADSKDVNMSATTPASDRRQTFPAERLMKRNGESNSESRP